VVGLLLGILVVLAIWLGGWWRQSERDVQLSFFTIDFLLLTALTGVATALGAIIAWPIWVGAVHAFLPRRVGQSLLDWQRGLSQKIPRLTRE
jgi:uncharacterized RDD family membrane protein YckC